MGRALFLEERLGVDCLRWAMTQELLSRVAVDDWLDALSLAVVAYDWRQSFDAVWAGRTGHALG